jgi:hypothetical protein
VQSDASGEGGGLRRWLQRKYRAKQASGLPPEGASAQPAVPRTSAEAQDAPTDQTDTPVLPPIESLDEHSDYRGFMSDKVSDELRRLALRKLFSLPQFNIRDDLNDYDEDFSAFRSLGDVIPHDMARGIERALKKAAASKRIDRDGGTACGQQVAEQAGGVAEAETQLEQNGNIASEPGTGETLPKG